jgi:5-methylcytosine-specific restriction enzyme subunit McrC
MIRVQNVYYMLAYAFSVLKEKAYRDVALEEFSNVADLCAAILERGIALQIKRGLAREYQDTTEPLAALRGKIEAAESIRTRSILHHKLICTFDEFSINSPANRILKSTVQMLLKNPSVSRDRQKSLRGLLGYFEDVGTVDLRNAQWNMQFNRNNQSYRMLLSICQMAVQGLLQTQENGTNRVRDFFDEQVMSRLYEKFLLEYFRKEHPSLNANPTVINWALDDEMDAFLPRMHTDITLTSGERILIIDAKYYTSNMQTRFDTQTVNSANLFQIFTYVKNMEANLRRRGDGRSVSGMLLYAKTDAEVQPETEYSMSGNRISVATIDLGTDFGDIRRQLDSIKEAYFH